VANGGGGRAAMLDPLRDRLPYSPDYALCPLSCPSISCNVETLDTPSSCCTLPAIESDQSSINKRSINLCTLIAWGISIF
jgi:hypothetical protein